MGNENEDFVWEFCIAFLNGDLKLGKFKWGF